MRRGRWCEVRERREDSAKWEWKECARWERKKGVRWRGGEE